METLTVTILEPKAKKLLEDLASLNLIKVQETEKPKRKPRLENFQSKELTNLSLTM